MKPRHHLVFGKRYWNCNGSHHFGICKLLNRGTGERTVQSQWPLHDKVRNSCRTLDKAAEDQLTAENMDCLAQAEHRWVRQLDPRNSKKISATLSILVKITENKQQTRKTHFINIEV